MSSSKYFLFLCQFLLIASCGPSPQTIPSKLHLVHLAHTKMQSNAKHNPLLEQIDWKGYDLLLLGGDLAKASSVDRPTMDYLNERYDLRNNNTLWSLGNHDYDDLDLVEEYTGRPPFYTYTYGDLCFLVLDTQDSLSNFIGDQLRLIRDVTDTLQNVTQLIVLHHKLVWMDKNEALQEQAPTLPNPHFGDCFHCTNPNNFYEAVYPALVAVQNRGIPVFCIAGDIGENVKRFSHRTEEGIQLLASGLDSGKQGDQVIEMEYDSRTKKMTWQFVQVVDLVDKE